MTPFNMNRRCRVQLLPKGIAIARQSPLRSLLKDDGQMTAQLWAIMQAFGPHIEAGVADVMETEIFLDLPEGESR